MGKGKGSVKNFQYRLRAGMPIILFKGWNMFSLNKIVVMIKKKLPKAFKIVLPKIQPSTYLSSTVLLNY